MQKKKVGLVIQGPLLSIGRAGNALHQSPEQLKAIGGVINFDCRENVQRIIDEYGNLFDEIVVSTWDSEVRPGDGWQGAKLVSQPDPGGIKQAGHYKDNNKFRQFVSTLGGLNELERSGVDYAVKMRTDQYLNLRLLLESFFLLIKSNQNPNAIYSTVTHLPTFLLHDLYFASKLSALKKFCEAILAYDKFEFISSVHREMILKHAYSEYRNQIGVPEWAYFPLNPPNGVSGETRKIFDFMFENVYFDLDPQIFRGTLWRGVHYEKDHIDRLVEKRDPSRRKFNIPSLIGIDWERYYNFKLQTEGKRITILNKLHSKIGKCGWDLLQGLKKVVRKVL